MAQELNGYVKVWRKVARNSLLGTDGVALAVFVHLLMLALRSPGKRPLKMQRVHLRRGQLATSPDQLAKLTGFNVKTIARRLDVLEEEEIIVQQKSNAGRIITIVNYSNYQATKKESVQQVSSRAVCRAVRRAETYGEEGEEEEDSNTPKVPAEAGAPSLTRGERELANAQGDSAADELLDLGEGADEARVAALSPIAKAVLSRRYRGSAEKFRKDFAKALRSNQDLRWGEQLASRCRSQAKLLATERKARAGPRGAVPADAELTAQRTDGRGRR